MYPDFLRDWYGTLTRIGRDYGELSGYRVGPFRFVLLNEPGLIEEVLVGRADELHKSWHERILAPILGHGLFLSEGDLWKRQRRMMAPPFRPGAIGAYADTMVRCTERVVARWSEGPREVLGDLYQITLAIVAETLFGGQIGPEMEALAITLDVARDAVGARITSPLVLPDWVPTPAVLRMRFAKRRLDALLDRFIAARRAEGDAGRADLLAHILSARDEDDGRAMTDRLVRDECSTLFIAGFETTATALGWTLLLLGRDQASLATALEEVDRVLGDRPAVAGDFPQLRFVTWVVQESMRLYSPAWAVGRDALDDLEIRGHRVARGTTIAACQWLMHRDPRYWDRPDEFVPLRWESDPLRQLPKYVYFPFGIGHRICIGNHFSMLEAVLVLATILQRYSFETLRDGRPTMKFVNLPDPGVLIRLKAR